MIGLFIIFMGVGILLCILGAIMYKYKKIEMLSLYDVRKKYDREGLAKAAGTDLITMGILTCIVTIVFIIVPGINIFIFGIVFTFIITFYSIKATKELKKYEIQ